MTRSVMVAILSCVFLWSSAGAAKPSVGKLAADVPREWWSHLTATPDGRELIELARYYDGSPFDGVKPVARITIRRLPVSAVNVAKTFDDTAQAAFRTGGYVLSQDELTKAANRIDYVMGHGREALTGTIVFKPAPGRPAEMIVIEASWFSVIGKDIHPVVEAVIASTRIK